MEELKGLFDDLENAITKEEAETFESLWNSASIRHKYHDEADQAKWEVSEFYKRVRPYGIPFVIRACRFILWEHFSGYRVEEDWYEATEKALQEIIERLEAYTHHPKEEAASSHTTTPKGRTLVQQANTRTTTEEAGASLYALEEENKQLQSKINELETEIEDLKQHAKGQGKRPPSGYNRTERAALLIELLEEVTGLTAEELTGVSAKIQKQGATSLGRVVEMVTDITEGQGRNSLNEYRAYLREEQQPKIKDNRLTAGRTHIKALAKEIQQLFNTKHNKGNR